MSAFRNHLVALVVSSLAMVLAACVFVVSTTNRALPFAGIGEQDIASPVRAHMRNGDMVVFREGAKLRGGALTGDGIRYDALRVNQSEAREVLLRDVLGLEAIERVANPGRTLVYSAGSIAVSAAFATALAVAIFGSCPTIYVDSAGTPALQAESFSYSIAPLLAKRDVDRLNVRADSAGRVRIEVRNEALETHYIDQLELLAATHRRDEIVLPAARAGLVAVSRIENVAAAVDSRGRNVAGLLAREDEAAFSSDDALLTMAANGEAPAEDYIDLVVPRPSGRDSLALLLKMRSSLLSTTVFYEHMLARPGIHSLDWVGRDLSHIASVARVAKWYTDNFGLRVLVHDGRDWRPVVRLMDFGPAAWRQVSAIVRDLPRGDSVRIRLAFTVDEWRIDRVAVAWGVRAAHPRTVPLSRTTNARGEALIAERAQLREADDRYLVTEPGSRFFAEFDVGQEAPGMERTYLVAADGYYSEWVRTEWIMAARDSVPFSTRTTKRDVLRSWRASKDSLEMRFFRDRVPVL